LVALSHFFGLATPDIAFHGGRPEEFVLSAKQSHQPGFWLHRSHQFSQGLRMAALAAGNFEEDVSILCSCGFKSPGLSAKSNVPQAIEAGILLNRAIRIGCQRDA
jgi:hypothetical protein